MTTNYYDAYRGFLTNKVYAGSNGPSYTYTPAGRLASRKWARGTNTTYFYTTAGNLGTNVYSDGTPGVTNTYDRLGRISSVICGATTTSFVYDLANDVLSESYTGGLLGGLTVSNQFDSVLRRTNMALLNGASTLCRTTNGYDAASRLATVSDGTNSATYSYLANSPLVGQIVFKSNTVTRMTTSKQYDYLNRLSSVSSTPSNSFTYQYNAANQRTMNQLADGSYWRYGYDSLGQVTLDNKYWVDETPVAGQQFDYAFDTIGNRTQTQAGGDQNGANLRVANYTNNILNQITSRSVPAYVDVMGDGLATNGVTVNGLTAYRKTEYFRQQLGVTNTSAVWDSVTVIGSGQTNTGHLFVPQNPENCTYDADGNLSSDGRWTNTWDAENRLASMTSLTTAPSGSLLQLKFYYDYMGRRIQKIVSTNNGSSYVGEYTNTFAYDGWNCLAILTHSLTLSNSFLWGLDLSGSIQGAGGVGGLLKVTYYGAATTNCFVAYDGNGNVSVLLNTANGVTMANYDYGPFGEVIRLSGPMAGLNPFRFLTKYDDDETDFLYYGLRYYNPSTGRWLKRDPMEEQGAPNLYLFVGNNPQTRFDLLGNVVGPGNPGSLGFTTLNSPQPWGDRGQVTPWTIQWYEQGSVPFNYLIQEINWNVSVYNCGIFGGEKIPDEQVWNELMGYQDPVRWHYWEMWNGQGVSGKWQDSWLVPGGNFYVNATQGSIVETGKAALYSLPAGLFSTGAWAQEPPPKLVGSPMSANLYSSLQVQLPVPSSNLIIRTLTINWNECNFPQAATVSASPTRVLAPLPVNSQ